MEDIQKTQTLKKLIISDVVVKFKCPNCGKGLIIRNNKERKLGLGWICPECGYTGP